MYVFTHLPISHDHIGFPVKDHLQIKDQLHDIVYGSAMAVYSCMKQAKSSDRQNLVTIKVVTIFNYVGHPFSG